MRRFLFNGRRLRTSYRNVPLDAIMALLSEAHEQDAYFDSCCLHRPLRKFRLKDPGEQ
jgi:3-hydroxy-3-methylglutaryl CoA synthase